MLQGNIEDMTSDEDAAAIRFGIHRVNEIIKMNRLLFDACFGHKGRAA